MTTTMTVTVEPPDPPITPPPSRIPSVDFPGAFVSSPDPSHLSTDSSDALDQLERFYDNYLTASGVSGAFAQVNASRAYANLYRSNGSDGPSAAAFPGNGVGIGFIDDGLDMGHPAFNAAENQNFNAGDFVAAGKTISLTHFGNASDNSHVQGRRVSHGTRVAGVAAGVRTEISGNTTEGIAPGADVRMFTYNPHSDDTMVIRAAVMNAVQHSDIDIINLSIQPPPEVPKVIDPNDEPRNFLPSDFGNQAGTPEKLFVWAAGNQNNADCKGLTFACGQDGKIDAVRPTIFAGLPIFDTWAGLRDFWTIVVAVKPDGEITDFSNRCGEAAEWCIAAPGQDEDKNERGGKIVGQNLSAPSSSGDGSGGINRTVTTVLGTSFAAPIVAGGLALMKQRFRDSLSNPELLARMYATANKKGIYAPDTKPDKDGNNTVSTIYGHGLLDIGAATGPVGTVMVSSVGDASLTEETLREASPLSAMRLETAEAFGDGVSRAFEGVEVAAFDSLAAPFWYPLERFAPKVEVSAVHRQMHGFMEFTASPSRRSPSGRSPSAGRENDRPRAVALSGGESAPSGESASSEKSAVPSRSENRAETVRRSPAVPTVRVPTVRVDFSTDRADMENGVSGKTGHLSYITAPRFAGVKAGGFSAYGFASPQWAERRGYGAVVSLGPFSSGYVFEPSSFLGTVSEGAFGELSGETGFVNLAWRRQLGNWQLAADAELGTVRAGAGGGLVSGVSRLLTSSFFAGLTRETAGGHALRLSVSSPLRIESGQMGFVIPVGRTPERGIVRRSLVAGLEPSGRQIDIGAQAVAQTRAGRFSIGTVASRHPGHNRDAGPSLSILAGYSASF